MALGRRKQLKAKYMCRVNARRNISVIFRRPISHTFFAAIVELLFRSLIFFGYYMYVFPIYFFVVHFF